MSLVQLIVAVLRTAIWFFYFFGAVIVLIPKMLLAKRLRKKGMLVASRDIATKAAHAWASALMRIAGVTVTVKGCAHLPTDRAVVLTPNHQSNYDIPLMLTQFPPSPSLVAKVETKKIPFVRTWMEQLDCIFLDRKNPRQAVTAMHEVSAVLARGINVVIFPEGTRSKGGPMRHFKSGAFKMACKAGALVVPVVIDGSYKAMEANHNLMCPAHVTITLLAPIDTAALDRAEQKELPSLVAARIAAHLPPENQPLPTPVAPETE